MVDKVKQAAARQSTAAFTLLLAARGLRRAAQDMEVAGLELAKNRKASAALTDLARGAKRVARTLDQMRRALPK